jgi:hypothetical protein
MDLVIKEMNGGVMPMSKKIAVEMENEAYSSNPHDVEDWKLIAPYTIGVKAFKKGNVIVLGIRGTADVRDLLADIKIALGNLSNTPRYKEDREYILKLQQQYPRSQYEYFAVGHSLGGAICDLLLAEGLVKEALTYNPAVELKYFKNSGNHRIYNEDDLLYKMMGQFTIKPEVRKNKKSFLQKAINLTTAGKLVNGLKAHLLSNFVGGVYCVGSGRYSNLSLFHKF